MYQATSSIRLLFRLLGLAQARVEVPGRALSLRLPAWD
jgi:hypothetical protein